MGDRRKLMGTAAALVFVVAAALTRPSKSTAVPAEPSDSERLRRFIRIGVPILIGCAGALGSWGWLLWNQSNDFPKPRPTTGGMVVFATVPDLLVGIDFLVVDPSSDSPLAVVQIDWNYARLADERLPDFEWVAVLTGDLAGIPVCDEGWTTLTGTTDTGLPVTDCQGSTDGQRVTFRGSLEPISAKLKTARALPSADGSYLPGVAVVVHGASRHGTGVAESPNGALSPVRLPSTFMVALTSSIADNASGLQLGSIPSIGEPIESWVLEDGGQPLPEETLPVSGGIMLSALRISVDGVDGVHPIIPSDRTVRVGPLKVWELVEDASPTGSSAGTEIVWRLEEDYSGPVWWRTANAAAQHNVGNRTFFSGVLLGSALGALLLVVEYLLQYVVARRKGSVHHTALRSPPA